MLILFLNLAARLLKRQDAARPAQMLFRSPNSGRIRIAILLNDASPAPQENTEETACLITRQQVA